MNKYYKNDFVTHRKYGNPSKYIVERWDYPGGNGMHLFYLNKDAPEQEIELYDVGGWKRKYVKAK